MIKFNFRGTFIEIPREEFAKTQDQYFLGNMINDIYESTEEEVKEIYINEDPDYARCIINSMIQREVIMDVNLDANGVYLLGDKWCCPHWFLSEIEKRDRYKNMVTQYDYLKDMTFALYQCKNCKAGFKLSENHSQACTYHASFISQNTNTWTCCAKYYGANTSEENKVKDGCKIGWHVPDVFHPQILKTMELFHKIFMGEKSKRQSTDI